MEKKPQIVISDKQAKTLYLASCQVISDMRIEAEQMSGIIRTQSEQLQASDKLIQGLKDQLAIQETLTKAHKALDSSHTATIVAQEKAITELTKVKFDLPRDQRKIW